MGAAPEPYRNPVAVSQATARKSHNVHLPVVGTRHSNPV